VLEVIDLLAELLQLKKSRRKVFRRCGSFWRSKLRAALLRL